jgi:hypothetical protein
MRSKVQTLTPPNTPTSTVCPENDIFVIPGDKDPISANLRLDRKVDVYETEQYCMKEETLTELGS